MATPSIKVLANADELLRVLGEGGPQTIADVARAMSIPRPSVYRLMDSMVHSGWVTSDDEGRVRLSADILRLGERAKHQNPLIRASEEPLRQLRDSTRQTVYLCVRRDAEIVCLDRLQGLSVGLLELVPGGTLPPHAGATARAIAAFDAQFVVPTDSLIPLTPRTLTSPEEVSADHQAIRDRGYSISDEDVTVGVAALGAPVWADTARLVGAISVAGMREDILREPEVLAAHLQGAAAAIAGNLTVG